MRHPWLILILVAVVAFITGRWSHSPPAADDPGAPIAANDSKRPRPNSSDSRDATPSSKSPRPRPANNKPPRLATEPLFQPGESKDWLRQQIKRNGWKDDPAMLFRVVQSYSAMDEEEISEMVATYQELIRNRRSASDAEQAAVPKEWLFKLGLFPALWRYSQLNPAAAMDIIEADPILKGEGVYQVALSNLTAVDPDRALARVAGLEGNDLRQAMEPILGTLFATDPDRVIRILEDYPDPVFDGERRKVAERLAADDPQKAIDYAIATIRAGRNPDVLKTAVETWREHSPEEANRWVSSYTGPGHETLK